MRRRCDTCTSPPQSFRRLRSASTAARVLFLAALPSLLLLFALVCHVSAKLDISKTDVTVHDLEGGIQRMGYFGANDQSVFVLTDKQLYITRDDAKTIEKQNDRLPGCQSLGCVNRSVPKPVAVSEADSNLMFLVAGVDGLKGWLTRDGGLSYETVATDAVMSAFLPNPTNPDLVIGLRCEGNQPRLFPMCTQEAYVGYKNSWRRLPGTYANISWGRKTMEGYVEDRVYALYPSPSARSRFDFGYGSASSSDFSITTLVENAAQFLFTDDFLFVARTNIDTQQVQLLVSRDNGHFITEGKMPMKLQERDYTILDTSEGSVFINVHHEDRQRIYGHVYLSDTLGSRFSLSFKNNRREPNGRCDFQKVKGLEGIYVANIVADGENTECLECNTDDECAKFCRIQTVITFDKGGIWTKLPTPKVDSNGAPIKCPPNGDECNLHLHGFGSKGRAVFTVDNAPGLIMATGNVGPYLSYDEAVTNTYFSRDGGVTWEELAKGTHVANFGDHGALMLAINSRAAVNFMYASFDEGKTWEKVLLEDDQWFTPKYIHTDPQNRRLRFIVAGVRTNFDSVLLSVDFTNVLTRKCAGLESPGTQTSDFEYFLPSTYSGGCLMGRKVEYPRRRREAECFVGEDVVEKPIRINNCPCTEADYECDYGFERSSSTGPCTSPVPISSKAPDVCPSDTKYRVTKGYRRVAGNTCEGGISDTRDATFLPCPVQGMSTAGIVLLVLFVVILAAVAGVALLYNKNERFRNFISDKLGRLRQVPGAYVQIAGNNSLFDEEEEGGGEFGLGDDDEAPEFDGSVNRGGAAGGKRGATVAPPRAGGGKQGARSSGSAGSSPAPPGRSSGGRTAKTEVPEGGANAGADEDDFNPRGV